MSPRHVSAFLLMLLPAGAASPARIQFLNHDQLEGSVESIGKDQIVWNSPLLEKAAPFQLDKILELNLPAGVPESAPGYEAVISLTNGDTLRGQLSSVTDQAIVLDTMYAGRLELKRPIVESVRIEERPKMLFHGPESLEGWTRTGSKSTAWTYDGGALVSSSAGSISRDVKLPDQFRIAFTMEWRASLHLKMICGSDRLDTETPPNCYELDMRRWVNFIRRSGRGSTTQLGRIPSLPEFNDHERANGDPGVRVELCVDRKKGIFNLIVDGQSKMVWTDADVKDAPTGGGIHFISGAGSSVRVSRIEVTAWDGQVEQPPDSEDLAVAEQQDKEAKEKAKELESGRMMLRNGDTLAGEVLGIENGVMKVKTRFSEMSLPVSRLKTVTLKPVSAETPKLRNGDIRAWFPDGGRVVFRLDSATPEALTGFSQNFGTATFKVSSFSRIEFNLYDPAFQELRGEKSW